MSVTIDWGDGATEEVEEVNGASHEYQTGGQWIINVRRSDDPSPESVAFEAVAPPPPPLQLTATPDGQNGLKVTIAISGGTPPYSFDWGDGFGRAKNFETAANDAHTYAAAGSFTITAIDSAPMPASGTTTFEAKAPEPKDLELDAQVDRSDPLKCNLTIAGADGKSQVVWGDGQEEMTTDGSPTAISHTYAPKGEPYTIAATDGTNHGRTSFIAVKPPDSPPTTAPASAETPVAKPDDSSTETAAPAAPAAPPA